MQTFAVALVLIALVAFLSIWAFVGLAELKRLSEATSPRLRPLIPDLGLKPDPKTQALAEKIKRELMNGAFRKHRKRHS